MIKSRLFCLLILFFSIRNAYSQDGNIGIEIGNDVNNSTVIGKQINSTTNNTYMDMNYFRYIFQLNQTDIELREKLFNYAKNQDDVGFRQTLDNAEKNNEIDTLFAPLLLLYFTLEKKYSDQIFNSLLSHFKNKDISNILRSCQYYIPQQRLTFNSVQFKNINFENTNLSGVSFRNATFDTVDFKNVVFEKTDFSGAEFREVKNYKDIDNAHIIVDHNTKIPIQAVNLSLKIDSLKNEYDKDFLASQGVNVQLTYFKGNILLLGFTAFYNFSNFLTFHMGMNIQLGNGSKLDNDTTFLITDYVKLGNCSDTIEYQYKLNKNKNGPYIGPAVGLELTLWKIFLLTKFDIADRHRKWNIERKDNDTVTAQDVYLREFTDIEISSTLTSMLGVKHRFNSKLYFAAMAGINYSLISGNIGWNGRCEIAIKNTKFFTETGVSKKSFYISFGTGFIDFNNKKGLRNN